MKLNLEGLEVASFATGAAEGAALAPTLLTYCGACPQRTYDCI